MISPSIKLAEIIILNCKWLFKHHSKNQLLYKNVMVGLGHESSCKTFHSGRCAGEMVAQTLWEWPGNGWSNLSPMAEYGPCPTQPTWPGIKSCISQSHRTKSKMTVKNEK